MAKLVLLSIHLLFVFTVSLSSGLCLVCDVMLTSFYHFDGWREGEKGGRGVVFQAKYSFVKRSPVSPS